MTNSEDFRWRAVTLIHVYDVPVTTMSEIFGPKPRTIRRWYAMFLRDGRQRRE